MAESSVFVFGYSVSYLYTNKYDGFVQIWQNYGSTGEKETWAHYSRRSGKIRLSVVLWPGLGF